MYNYIANAEGVAFVNKEEQRMVNESDYCECVFINPHETPLLELTPYVQLAYKNNVIQSKLIGKYNYDNIIAAINIANHFKITDTVTRLIEIPFSQKLF